MNLKEYIKSKLTIGSQPDLKMIYEELRNLGIPAYEIYNAINEQIKENINQAIEKYLKDKNEE